MRNTPVYGRLTPASDYLGVRWRYLTQALCDAVFAAVREHERQRKWTLYALVQFWIALLHDGPEVIQMQAVTDCACGHPRYPVLTATPESFFRRIQALRPAFLRAVVERATAWMREHVTALPVRFVAEREALATALAHHPRLRLVVADILCQPRSGKRRKRRFCAGRHQHTSFAKLHGGKRYLKR